ncbi:MAG: hypothetical protein OXC54_10425 [Rhodospirillaceae bacterium]|nr:hypothetical protein [Rhodospirillaceae bacterium]MCY4311704.1 hypothetical protein [Rhodospirillaceae bacterium]
MSDLNAIAALFQHIENSLEDLRERHDAANEANERDRIERWQKLNEQAYFVLAWGQLEADIDDACRHAIRHGKAHDDWRCRRAWSAYDEENPRLSFRNRLMLVLDRNSEEWKRILELYKVRNQIAHGDLRHAGINLPTVIEDFHRIQSSLVRD